MSSGRDVYLERITTTPAQDWTPQEEEYWRDLVAKQREEVEAREYQKRHDAAHEKVLGDMLRRAKDKQVGGDHYKNMGVEPWGVVDTWPLEQRIGAYRHGALKYLMRMGSKDEQLQEIKKCGHYIEKLIEVLESV